LWFLHADTLPPVNALEEIAAAIENGATAGNFSLRFAGSSRAARQLTFIYPLLRVLRLCYGDSGIFVSREIYHRVGGFRELPLFEDLDLLRRLRRAGVFVHLRCALVTSSRRFEDRNFALVWVRWIALQLLYWCGVSPHRLARWYSR
jgi:GT2 family glycosyltransferase